MLGVVTLGACDSDTTSDDSSGGSGSTENKITDDYDTNQIKSKLAELRNANGYKITYKVEVSSNDEEETVYITSAATENILYYKDSEGNESYYDLSSETQCVCYSKSSSESEWSTTTIPYTDEINKSHYEEFAYAVSFGYMSSYSSVAIDGEFNKSTTTIAGRSCDKYSYDESYLNVYTLHYEVCVDKATGVCLKWSASASESVSGESGSENFECTEFLTSVTLELPVVA